MMLDGQSAAAIATAAQALRAGELVGMPTETVYGLAADATQRAAVAKIFAAKGRPADHPLIVHVAEAADAVAFASSLPDFAQALMRSFWPGPLTVIVPRADGVAEAAAGGQDTVGLRCPSHPVAQALLRASRSLGVPGLAAPSANAFGRVSPTRAVHVQQEFGDALLILDGGDARTDRAGLRAAPARHSNVQGPGGAARLGHAGGPLRPQRAGAADGCQNLADRTGCCGQGRRRHRGVGAQRLAHQGARPARRPHA